MWYHWAKFFKGKYARLLRRLRSTFRTALPPRRRRGVAPPRPSEATLRRSVAEGATQFSLSFAQLDVVDVAKVENFRFLSLAVLNLKFEILLTSPSSAPPQVERSAPLRRAVGAERRGTSLGSGQATGPLRPSLPDGHSALGLPATLSVLASLGVG